MVTDCQVLLHLNAHKTANPQIARWSLAIQEYDFVVHHWKGKRMQHADALSHAPVDPPADMEQEIANQIGILTIILETKLVRMYQHQDADINNIVTSLAAHLNFEVSSDILYRKDRETGRKLFVAPKAMRKSLCIQYHDLLGHFSVEKVIAAMKQKFWFAGMCRYVRRHIQACFECLLAKNCSGKEQGLLHLVPPATKLFERIHLDHLGPFEETSAGNAHVLVLIDALSKFVLLFVVPDTSSNEVEHCLKIFFLKYGLPDRIVSDWGSCYTSKQFEEFCK